MAVYTPVSDDELQAFLADYDVGEVTSFAGIAEGVENSNFLVRTTRSTYILTLYEKRVKAAELPFFIGLMDHLAKKGLSCPEPVAARDGVTLRTLNGRPAAVVTFLEGMWHRRIQPVYCRSLGASMAAMHVADGEQRLDALRPRLTDADQDAGREGHARPPGRVQGGEADGGILVGGAEMRLAARHQAA